MSEQDPFLNTSLSVHLQYLQKLPDIGAGWSKVGHDQGFAPTRAVCTVAQEVLEQVDLLPEIKNFLTYKDVLVSAVPTGGVLVIIREPARQRESLVTLNNDGTAEITLHRNQQWTTVACGHAEVASLLVYQLKGLLGRAGSATCGKSCGNTSSEPNKT
jgi:hypothetical protein